MNRVTPTTACVRAAALGCVLLLTVCGPASGAEPELALDEADAIVLEAGASLYDGPYAGALKVGELAPWSRLKLESRGLADLQFDENFCTIRWSIMTEEGRRWVDGAALAVRQAVPTMGGRESLLDTTPHAGDRSSVPDTSWFGYERKHEWSEKFGCDRLVQQGWLFTSRNGTVSRAQLTYTSGWGTSEELEQRSWIDLDGDGEAELVSEWSTSITEAGYGGRLVRVLGQDLKPKLELSVGDPRLMGLGQSAWGQLRLLPDAQRLIHETISELACPTDAPSAPTQDPSPQWGETICFDTKRTTWKKLVPSTEPFAATANGKTLVGWYHPEGRSASSAAPVQVLVWNGQAYEWLDEPTVSPAWLSGVFAADAKRVRWVELN